MRLSTVDGAEFRFWLTRRYVRIVWLTLHQLTLAGAAPTATQSPAAQAAMADFQREQALDKTDFDSDFKAQAQALPLGSDPVLLTKVQGKQGADSTPILCLHSASGTGIDLALEPQISHSLLALLESAVRSAQWQTSPPSKLGLAAAMPATGSLN